MSKHYFWQRHAPSCQQALGTKSIFKYLSYWTSPTSSSSLRSKDGQEENPEGQAGRLKSSQLVQLWPERSPPMRVYVLGSLGRNSPKRRPSSPPAFHAFSVACIGCWGLRFQACSFPCSAKRGEQALPDQRMAFDSVCHAACRCKQRVSKA